MTDETALLRALVTNPDDITARLVYLDCLDELGRDPDFTSFARADIARVAAGAPDVLAESFVDLRERNFWPDFWAMRSPTVFLGWSRLHSATVGRDVAVLVSAGFVEGLAIPMRSFDAAAPLFAAHPVRAVRFWDKKPVTREDIGGRRSTPSWHLTRQDGYTDGAAAALPGWAMDRLAAHPKCEDWIRVYDGTPGGRFTAVWFATDAVAMDALSEAAVDEGRHCAGLPPVVRGTAGAT